MFTNGHYLFTKDLKSTLTLNMNHAIMMLYRKYSVGGIHKLNNCLLFWEILVNFTENSVYSLLFLKCLKKRKSYEKHTLLLYLGVTIVLTVITCLCNFCNLSYITTQLVLLCADLLISIVLFQNNLPKKLLIAIQPACISILADKITFSIGSIIFSTSLVEFNPSGSHRIYSTLMYLVICLLASLIFMWLSNFNIYLTTPLCIATCIIIILGIICTNFFLDIIIETQYLNVPYDIRLRFQFLNAGFIIIFLFLLLLIKKTGTAYEDNLKLEKRLCMEQINRTELELSTQSMKNIRSWKHDYKNHIITITALAENKRYSELLEYLKKLQDNLPEYFVNISSGNTAIDAIITNKLIIAKQYGIHFEYSIMLSEICPLSDLEITAILGNLLDNSLEACKKILEEKSTSSPSIQVIIKPFRDMLKIQIVNSSNGKYTLAPDNLLKTTKKDASFHGYGIKRVTDIIKDVNGIIKIQPEQEQFTVILLIPISN